MSDSGYQPDRAKDWPGIRAWIATAALMVTWNSLPCQSSAGGLAGKLTDIHSRPLDGVTIILKNVLTGKAVRTVTAKSGTYRFMDLEPGEYELQAASPLLGAGSMDGVEVFAGHESRVRTAVTLNREVETPAPSRKPDAAAAIGAEEREPLAPASGSRPALIARTSPAPATSDFAIRVAGMPAAAVELRRGVGTAAVIAAASAAKMALAVLRLPAPLEAASATAGEGTAISGEQVQQLPLPGRHWEDFLLEAPAVTTSNSEGSSQSESSGRQAGVTLDGISTRLAFGGRVAGRGGGALSAGPGEASIEEFRITDREVADAGEATGDRVRLTSPTGTNRLHGQIFFFDRQNLWGAQNPFTQWVKESAAGTSLTTPSFTAYPYSPGDTENRWGAGAGGSTRRHRLLWFASTDGDERNDPAVSTVKHPANFFAQPSNDELQVLSARLGTSSANPVEEGLAAYSGMLESLAGLLGPAPRTSQHWSGFGRVDRPLGERHRISLEGSVAGWNSPGGGLTRASETFGNHSFGAANGSSIWVLGQWEAFLTPNLLAVTQGAMGLVDSRTPAQAPSQFEQSFKASAWEQLPQMTVDSRYGFTIGNPARFGPGDSPDEHIYEAKETLNWVRGGLLVKAGFDLRHNADSTSLLRDHTGTYFYSNVEGFVSDALVFAKYGLSDPLDPMQQHNCDQREKAWRDPTGQLHGLGYLPCYSYYKQTLGPTDWYLSTNDWAGFATTQWQPVKTLVMTAAVRWDGEQLPPPIGLVDNPDLPLTQHLPNLGSQWSPRISLAWGRSESRWPVFRAGYGVYAGRTANGVLESALTQTGSLKGDLNFFMRPTDNLLGGGAPPFPYVLGGVPASAEKPGVVEFGPGFRNPQIHQGVAEMESKLPGGIVISASALVSLARELPVTIDTNYDPAVNPKTITYAVVDGTGKGPIKQAQITVPFFASWPGGAVDGRLNGNYQQTTEIQSRANSTYEAAIVRVARNARHGLSLHARYTYGHAMDWNPNESAQMTGSSVFDPSNFALEYGTSNLDVRNSASAMAIWQSPWDRKGTRRWLSNGWSLSGTALFRSGLPYTMRTAGSITREFESSGVTVVGLGPGMNGYGGDDRVYGVGRNTFRYPHTWKADVRMGRRISLGHEREIELLAESFNLFNHQNVTELETTGYSVEPGSVSGTFPTLNFLTGLKTGQTEFGQPLNINAVDFYRERQFDLGLRVRF